MHFSCTLQHQQGGDWNDEELLSVPVLLNPPHVSEADPSSLRGFFMWLLQLQLHKMAAETMSRMQWLGRDARGAAAAHFLFIGGLRHTLRPPQLWLAFAFSLRRDSWVPVREPVSRPPDWKSSKQAAGASEGSVATNTRCSTGSRFTFSPSASEYSGTSAVFTASLRYGGVELQYGAAVR